MTSDTLLLGTLRDVGLAEKEAAVYLAALKLGPCTVLQLARHSGIRRTTVYSVIEGLRSRNLLRKEARGIKEYFVAAHPEVLQSLLEQRQQSFQAALPDLEGLFKIQGASQVVRYYEGLEGMKSVYLSLLKSVKIGDDYLVLSTMEEWHTLAPDFFDSFLEKRSRLDIKVRMILTPSPLAAARKGPKRKANERTRILPKGTRLTTNLIIVPTKVVIHQLVPPIRVMVVENEHIVRLHREMYELIWRTLAD